MSISEYKTTELELASFLKAQGHTLLGAQLKNRLVEFTFPAQGNGSARFALEIGRCASH